MLISAHYMDQTANTLEEPTLQHGTNPLSVSFLLNAHISSAVKHSLSVA